VTDSYLGIDVGTSGVRAILIDAYGEILSTSRAPLAASFEKDNMLCQQPADWWQAVLTCLQHISAKCDLSSLQAIAIDGTSGTTLLTDGHNTPISPALMYNDVRPAEFVSQLCKQTPPVPACSRSGGLAKAAWLCQGLSFTTEFHIQQQADWILSQFSGKPGISDWNNVLKMGFDVEQLAWPEWLKMIDLGKGRLPDAYPPGKRVATISADIAKQTGLPETTQLHAGTTDSIAAFIASGASQPGDAVTSLGSTLVLKLCTRIPIVSENHGIYSHRLDEKRWLAGGASNSGGSVLKNLFSDNELVTLSEQMLPEQDTGFDYYPLPSTGERFPIPDADKKPVIYPVPENRAIYLQAIFEGIARIEKHGYDLLEELGAETVQSIRTAGGGAVNAAWTSIRKRIVKRPLLQADHTEAAYGSALLAAGRL
jgi:sugar (pentulose or hexulose) kinase